MEFPVKRPIEREPTHPGELMREILEDAGLSITEAARRMEISRQALHGVLNGSAAVTAEMALRFARLVGGEPELYLQMQVKRDLWLAGQRFAALAVARRAARAPRASGKRPQLNAQMIEEVLKAAAPRAVPP